MNIFDFYENYRQKHSIEFRRLLEDVAQAVLATTENIPEELVLKTFKSTVSRRYLHCYNPDNKENALFLCFDGKPIIGQYSYDDTAAKELDKFMAIYYPGIIATRSYCLDLYEKKVEFCFEFEIEFKDEDFDLDEDEYNLKEEKREKDIECTITTFNDDVSELLQHKFDMENWKDLNYYCLGGIEEEMTGYLNFGETRFEISIN